MRGLSKYFHERFYRTLSSHTITSYSHLYSQAQLIKSELINSVVLFSTSLTALNTTNMCLNIVYL